MPGFPSVERGPEGSRLPGMDSTPGPISSRFGLRGALRRRAPARCGATSWCSAMPISSSAGLWTLRRGGPTPARFARRPSPCRGGKKFCRRVVGHRQLGRAQAFDLVAQPRGFFEVEVGGGGAHAGFEIADHGLEIVADGGGVLELAFGAGAGADQHVVALIDAVEDVADALAHAFRGDAVCGVVGRLLFAPARGLRHGAFHRAGDASA